MKTRTGRSVEPSEGGVANRVPGGQDGRLRSATGYGTAVAVTRIGMGLLGLLAPSVTQRLSLLDRQAPSTVHIWTQFWATRAIGLGAGYIAANTLTRRHLVRTGLLVDGLDTAFLLAMGTRRDVPTRAVLWLAAITATAAIADAAEIRRETSRPSRR